ncbi:xanthine dehydrogenase accessory protein XdhC [Roseivivax isoporae]|uniref:Xanthine dehydrogenase accessory protein XdhC n=1 Tax=Roseivivax isoporae LMG 25204 TaxID=1449351 RepID=X7F6R4_9RHOB|nr:xanthine dehydrogenase accessory protein XdhC [Roseivivax isoporae]ETX28582.1 xanthine dehydrogenase accessory protein XdhC [Roseivivax isoporae LMG 25204]
MSLAAFLDAHRAVVRVALGRVRGSSPREAGTEMFVADTDLHGTIGGGRLEYMAIARAREMLREGILGDRMDLPLGPEIGQCCGGRVEVTLARMGARDRAAAHARDEAARAAAPEVLIFGAGHVGRAIADLMQHMPVRAVLLDTRPEELGRATARVEMRVSVLPEADVALAGRGAAFIVATHDHALDFLVADAALARGDAAYVGLIGSRTKRAKFDRFVRDHGTAADSARLTCPIGAGPSRDKRPAIIAACVTAEVMTALTTTAAAGPRLETPCRGMDTRGAAIREVPRG